MTLWPAIEVGGEVIVEVNYKVYMCVQTGRNREQTPKEFNIENSAFAVEVCIVSLNLMLMKGAGLADLKMCLLFVQAMSTWHVVVIKLLPVQHNSAFQSFLEPLQIKVTYVCLQ